MNSISKKGFTLVELLIVIGILAVLATTAVLILNPAQLLAQARDSQRMSDLTSLDSAIDLYTVDITQTTQDFNGDDGTIGVQNKCDGSDASNASTYIYRPSGSNTITTASFSTNRQHNVYVTSKAVGATGWLPIRFGDITTSSPLSVLPVDPVGLVGGNTDFVYRYACQQTSVGGIATYEVNACLESGKYKPLMGTDGGNKPAAGTAVLSTDTCASNSGSFYEIGTDQALDL